MLRCGDVGFSRARVWRPIGAVLAGGLLRLAAAVGRGLTWCPFGSMPGKGLLKLVAAVDWGLSGTAAWRPAGAAIEFASLEAIGRPRRSCGGGPAGPWCAAPKRSWCCCLGIAASRRSLCCCFGFSAGPCSAVSERPWCCCLSFSSSARTLRCCFFFSASFCCFFSASRFRCFFRFSGRCAMSARFALPLGERGIFFAASRVWRWRGLVVECFLFSLSAHD